MKVQGIEIRIDAVERGGSWSVDVINIGGGSQVGIGRRVGVRPSVSQRSIGRDHAGIRGDSEVGITREDPKTIRSWIEIHGCGTAEGRIGNINRRGAGGRIDPVECPAVAETVETAVAGEKSIDIDEGVAGREPGNRDIERDDSRGVEAEKSTSITRQAKEIGAERGSDDERQNGRTDEFSAQVFHTTIACASFLTNGARNRMHWPGSGESAGHRIWGRPGRV